MERERATKGSSSFKFYIIHEQYCNAGMRVRAQGYKGSVDVMSQMIGRLG